MSDAKCTLVKSSLPTAPTLRAAARFPWDLLVPQHALWGHLLKGNPQRKACSDYIVYFSHIYRVRGELPVGIPQQPCVPQGHKGLCLIDL